MPNILFVIIFYFKTAKALSDTADPVSSRSPRKSIPSKGNKMAQKKVKNVPNVMESAMDRMNTSAIPEKSELSQTESAATTTVKKKMAKRLDFMETDSSSDNAFGNRFTVSQQAKSETNSPKVIQELQPGDMEEPSKKRPRRSSRTTKEHSLFSQELSVGSLQNIPAKNVSSKNETDPTTVSVSQSAQIKPQIQKAYKYHNPALSPVIHAPKSEFGDTLPLPAKYKLLEDLFKLLETVMMYFKRTTKQHCTLHNLQLQIEKLSQCRFEQKHLQQILELYPEAYTVEYRQLRNPLTGNDEWQLMLNSTIEKMTDETILNRRRQFHTLLLDRVKQYHNAFLAQKNLMPLQVNKELTEWHSEFPLEDVEDLPLAPLPEPPATHTDKKQTQKVSSSTSCRRQQPKKR
jgi:hypothetical protein